MNKKNLSLKVDEYTINLHRGQEESEKMKQKRMALCKVWKGKRTKTPIKYLLKGVFALFKTRLKSV